MVIRAEVAADGTLKIVNPETYEGKTLLLVTEEESVRQKIKPTPWSGIEAILKKSDQLDIQRKNIEEILYELRATRETL